MNFFKIIILVFCLQSIFHFSSAINPENITIVRDEWGVPHIFAKTDAEVAYGLAWAHAEDDFKSMQEPLLIGKQMYGRVEGKDGAVRDFLVHAVGINDLVEERYEKDLSEDFRKYVEAYAAGLNAYAKAHPDEVLLRRTFPIDGKDILKGAMFTLTAVTGAHNYVQKVFENKMHTFDANHVGSNAYAVSSNKSADGDTYLSINPHTPMEGSFSWYEVGLHSEEGLNILGGLFPGGTSIFVGSNKNLGWTHTWNGLNLVDVYELEMHPKKRNHYKFDDEWIELEKRPVWLKVGLTNWLRVPVRRMTYWSKYGATFKSDEGYFAVRYGSNMDIRTLEQWYRMNKAQNFEEFYEVLEMNALPRFNIVYADRDDNIFYINLGMIPKRDPELDWSGIMAGNTSKTLWTEFYQIPDVPQVLNPDCGYVFNVNNTPYSATCEAENIPYGSFSKEMGFRLGNNNRAARFSKLINTYDKIDFEYFKNIKWDNNYPDSSHFIQSISEFFELPPSKFPEITRSLKYIHEWDKKADKNSIGASLVLISLNYVFDKLNYNDQTFIHGVEGVQEDLYIEAVTFAQNHLLTYFNSIDVPLGRLQRHIRGDVSLPDVGFPDALAARYSQKNDNGEFETFIGDAYTMFVRYNSETEYPEMWTVHPFGASSRPDSPHYTDQMELYVNYQTKRMTLNREEIFENAQRIYHPK